MAATMTLHQSAKILPFRQPCASVNRTDRNKRLPTLTSDEIESYFDLARLAAEQTRRAA
jgi:hypothetical protein